MFKRTLQLPASGTRLSFCGRLCRTTLGSRSESSFAWNPIAAELMMTFGFYRPLNFVNDSALAISFDQRTRFVDTPMANYRINQ
jgi:hypothetical protein